MTNANTTPPAGEVEKVTARLRSTACILEDNSFDAAADDMREAASLLTTYAEDNERLRGERDLLRAESDAKTQTISAMQDRVDWAYKQKEAAEAGHRMQTKATLAFREDWLASQAQAEEMRKALEEIKALPMQLPLSHVVQKAQAIARAALMKGGE